MPSNAKRKRRNLIQVVVVLGLLIVGVFSISKFRAHSEQNGKFKVTFETETGETRPFYLEVAANDPARNRGLMFRKPGELEPDEGMIFVFPRESRQSFWMKNTYISLDMLFVNQEKKVVGILHDVPVLNQKPRNVSTPSMYVVELLAGTAKKHGIKEGSKMRTFQDIPAAS